MDLPKMPLRELLTIGEGTLGIVHLGRVFKKNKKLLCLLKKKKKLSFPHRYNYFCEDAFHLSALIPRSE